MQFFKTLIASTLGALIAAFIIFIVFFLTLVSSTSEPEPYVRDNTVLKLNISGNIPSKTTRDPFDEILRGEKKDIVSLESLKDNLDKAAVHDKIKGVWLNIDFVTAGWAHLQEAHNLIRAFKDSSGKFVYASTNDLGYNEAGYYLATAADSIFSPPESLFEFDGFYSQVMFYTGLLEKLGIEAEITRHGKYKSAVEPYFREELSEESEYQLQQIIEDVTTTFVQAISEKTGKSPDEINGLLNDVPSLMVQDAYVNGLVDTLLYPNEVESLIKRRIGISEDRELQTISNGRYLKVSKQTAGISTPSTSDKIAVIYANGLILPSPDGFNPFDNEPIITAATFRDQLDEVREDDDIKALVVRINSPGGSGSTSDVIWHMLRETSKEIPVIASMGPVAASGGYYIAMAADTIVAQPTTVTGSIGVFSTKFNARELFNDKLGITFDEVKSHQHADWLNATRGFSPEEETAYQAFTDRFYQNFISKAAQTRGMTAEEVDEVGQGRVWTGEDAQEQQLVDLMGGLDKALSVAAEKAGITDYKIEAYPKPRDFFEMLMGSAQAEVKSWFGVTPYDSYIEDMMPYFSTGNGDLLLFYPYKIEIQ